MLGIALGGCSQDSAPEVVVPPGVDAGRDATAFEGGQDDASNALDAADEAPGDAAADVETSPVIVGLSPAPQWSGDTGGATAARADAILVVLASGARGLVLERPWSDLQPSLGDSWLELERVCAFLAGQRRLLLLSVKSVDAVADLRPADLRGTPWNQPSTRQQMHGLIDRIYAACRDTLAYLSLGLELDRYLDSHLSQSPAFTQFALDATDYARTHPNRPDRAAVGWTWSAASWLADSGMTEANALVEASDAVMLTYTPVDDDGYATAPSGVLAAVSSLASRIETHPIVLQRAVYPSSELIGGSEGAQAQFVQSLFASVEAHRSRYPFVGVGPLHDPPPEDCVAYAEAQGKPGSAELYAAWCSVGLRDGDGTAKAAFSVFVEAAAGLLEP